MNWRAAGRVTKKRATELAALLEFRLIHGKLRREPKEKE